MDLFLEDDAKNKTLISWIWRKELNRLIFENDSQNWTFFFVTQRIKTFLQMTQRIELIFEMTRIELLEMAQRNELFSISTHKIEPFFFEYDQRIGLFVSWVWRNELNR